MNICGIASLCLLYLHQLFNLKVDAKIYLCKRLYTMGLQRSRKNFCAFCAKLNW
ncbi:hypothetical protein D1AOALGA4SA_8151 [Olavius algarvensis Delta 1 endosymbiont]|nr:hypothetical protein D1AOALGA4SA_8151 [Olavius algarvensis Delta 1 endosymbiont]